MSNVYKALRKKSEFDVIDKATELRNQITEYIYNDFDVEKLSDKNKEFVIEERKAMINYLRLATSYLELANRIYVTNLREYEERRLNQDKAIGMLGNIQQELQFIKTTLKKENININKYTTCCTLIEQEIQRVKNWRQSENHFKNDLKLKETNKVQQEETDRIRQSILG